MHLRVAEYRSVRQRFVGRASPPPLTPQRQMRRRERRHVALNLLCWAACGIISLAADEAGLQSDSLRVMQEELHHAMSSGAEEEIAHEMQAISEAALLSDSLRLMLREPAARHEPNIVGDESTLARQLDEMLLALHSLSQTSSEPSSGRTKTGVASDSDGRLRLEHSSVDESHKEDAAVGPHHLAGLFLTFMTLVGLCAFVKRRRSALSTSGSEVARRILVPAVAAAAVGTRPPDMFLCPISCEIMEDPVVTAAGESQCLALCDSACFFPWVGQVYSYEWPRSACVCVACFQATRTIVVISSTGFTRTTVTRCLV